MRNPSLRKFRCHRCLFHENPCRTCEREYSFRYHAGYAEIAHNEAPIWKCFAITNWWGIYMLFWSGLYIFYMVFVVSKFRIESKEKNKSIAGDDADWRLDIASLQDRQRSIGTLNVKYNTRDGCFMDPEDSPFYKNGKLGINDSQFRQNHSFSNTHTFSLTSQYPA